VIKESEKSAMVFTKRRVFFSIEDGRGNFDRSGEGNAIGS